MPLPHRIRRLRWRVTSHARDEAFPVRARLRQLHDADLLTALEPAFDAVSAGDEWVHIPRIELAVRVRDAGEISAAIGAEMAHELARRQVVRRSAHMASIGGSEPQESARALNAADVLVDYLQSGLLPWPLANLGRESALSRLVVAAIAQRDRVIARVPAALPSAIAFLFRWMQLVPASEWTSMARQIEARAHGASASGLADAVAALTDGSPSSLHSHRRRRLVAALLAIAIRPHSGDRNGADEAAALASMAPEQHERPPARALDALMRQVPVPTAAWITTHVVSETDAASRDVSRVERPLRVARPAPPQTPTVRSERHTARGVADPPPPLEPPQAPDRPTIDTNGAFGLAIDHAGLVLLHAFLPQLFETTGIAAAGDRSLRDDRLPRAAALLSFVALGYDDPVEFELGLIKVLLGRRPDATVLVSPGLIGPADRDETDALLASVVGHWRALKQTSPAGVRASFLQRRGLLSDIDGAWRLRVEPQSFDFLVDQLPWSISTVKLPWMTTPLFTEWTTP